jgi:hypothetical protein
MATMNGVVKLRPCNCCDILHLLSDMAKELHLDRKDFLKLIDCPLSEEDYIKI